MVTLVDVDSTWVNPAAVEYHAAELRRADAATFVATGIVLDADDALAVTVDGSDQVTVQPGSVVIPADAVTGNGVYRAGLASATAATALDARDATNGRIDLVVFRQLDTDVVGSHTAYTGRVEVITGTPSATPSVPAAPSMSVELARITVPVNGGAAASVDSSHRTYACAVGGVIPVGSSARLPATAPTHQRAVALDDGAGWTFDGTDWVRDFEAARIRSAAQQDIVNATEKELTQLTTEVRSDGDLHTAGASSLVASVAGWYDIGAMVTWAVSATGFRYLRIMRNQTDMLVEHRTNAVSGSDTVNNATTTAYLSAGDLITVNVYQSSGGTLAVRSTGLTHLWASRRR